ncbi:uncharacterized protein MELLADRAFT_86762 [Melampsora larici-populina 98AG31]|uniref:Uncharacterized protein n=1 Tax=Melampsora larici-populina (strain 98AG31 / pathotype 3-4-7) TaxID=747676 RepID=F4R3B6_MELLP|nr:uncharacterized protein MELLADRAFT_86762 [Melampsora larici-populina 98AG31]EGG12599.1 hypothetical protein MELLADRAFT_86762 [Melampsora larici-populina 98AG31]
MRYCEGLNKCRISHRVILFCIARAVCRASDPRGRISPTHGTLQKLDKNRCSFGCLQHSILTFHN